MMPDDQTTIPGLPVPEPDDEAHDFFTSIAHRGGVTRITRDAGMIEVTSTGSGRVASPVKMDRLQALAFAAALAAATED